MFDMIEKMQSKFFHSIQEDLDGIFRSSGMEISPEVSHSIGAVLHELFSLDPQNLAGVILKKAPKDLGDKYNDRGIFNVIPGANTTSRITDTLVIFCLGSDNLNTRLADFLIAVGKHRFKNVIFVTSKWDIAAITGNNTQRLQDLIEFRQAGSRFCFILVSTCGISMIPVI